MKNIACFIMALLLAVFLCGCGAEVETLNKNKNASMFVCVETTSHWFVLYHKETKVMYAVSRYGAGSGVFTVLVNQDGSPMIYGE